MFLEILFGLFGLASLIGIAWLFSVDKRAVDWRLVLTGVSLQIAFAAFVLLTPYGAKIFGALAHGFVALSGFTFEGARLIFGDMASAESLGKALDAGQQMHVQMAQRSLEYGPPEVDPTTPLHSQWNHGSWRALGFVFAFQVLPTIIFFAAFMGLLYHLGVMQKIVQGMAWAITKVMRVSGAETTSVCASIFIGQTEAPLTVRPYIPTMTNSELLTMMIGGMAHIAGGVMAAYIQMLGGSDPEQQAFFARHFLAASIMAAPATLVIAKVLVPETGEPLTRGSVKMHVEKTTTNVIDAAAAGAADGLKLALNIAAMLLAFTALIALLNAVIAWGADASGITGWINAGRATPIAINLGTILGVVLSPIAWLIGIPWEDAIIAGGLIGQKIVLNEFIAYGQLAGVPVGDGAAAIAPHTKLILTYALCGFANFSSIAIQIGGIGGLAPERRHDLARFGLRAVLGGSLATFMTATIAGVLSRLA